MIEASWIALVDSFEYKLYKDEEQTAMSTAVERKAEVKAASTREIDLYVSEDMQHGADFGGVANPIKPLFH